MERGVMNWLFMCSRKVVDGWSGIESVDIW